MYTVLDTQIFTLPYFVTVIRAVSKVFPDYFIMYMVITHSNDLFVKIHPVLLSNNSNYQQRQHFLFPAYNFISLKQLFPTDMSWVFS